MIFADDLEQIFGKRKWESRNEELMRENENAKTEKKEDASVSISEGSQDNENKEKDIPEVDVEKPKED